MKTEEEKESHSILRLLRKKYGDQYMLALEKQTLLWSLRESKKWMKVLVDEINELEAVPNYMMENCVLCCARVDEIKRRLKQLRNRIGIKQYTALKPPSSYVTKRNNLNP